MKPALRVALLVTSALTFWPVFSGDNRWLARSLLVLAVSLGCLLVIVALDPQRRGAP